MESLIKLLYDWEIQLLVLLSFAIQIFLFFIGGLRRHSNNMFLRLSIWIVYLGADTVAVYALGYLSRHTDATTGGDTLRGTHQLAFFWAPFLLIHLGGQDTITAFSMEDNNLWLRHLLNLLVQVVLAIYVFWKSIGRHNMKLIVSGIFVFVAGIIKYGERTWSLRCGSFQSLEGSSGNRYKHRLPEVTDGDTSYSNTVCMGLRSMPAVVTKFTSRMGDDFVQRHEDQSRQLKLTEIELGLMYKDLYTKALALRTRSGIILRCISQICAVVAFILFLAGDRRSYSRADIVITYSLFIGGFFLDVCAVIILMASPWTWAWLKAQKYDNLAQFSWFLFSSDLIGWPEKKPLWSNAMGQYNFFGSYSGSGQHQLGPFNQRSMTLVRKLATLLRVEKKKIFWMSKLLDTKNVKADEMMGCLLEAFNSLSDPREWSNLGLICSELFEGDQDFGIAIVFLHMITELHLSEYPCSDVEANIVAADTATEDINVLVEECRKLSRYMMYLLVTHPSLLPLTSSAVDTLKQFQDFSEDDDIRTDLRSLNLQRGKETLEEIKEVWIRLIIYAAFKSRADIHMAQLARGGEFLTFVWLFLAKNGFGSHFNDTKIELIRGVRGPSARMVYAIDISGGANQRHHQAWRARAGTPADPTTSYFGASISFLTGG